TIRAEWIAQAVRKQAKIDVRGATIKGDLNLHSLQCEGEISLTDCEFTGAVDFSYSVFKQNLTFTNSLFDKAPDFSNSSCEYDLVLQNARFAATRDQAGETSEPTEVRFLNLHVKGILVLDAAEWEKGVTANFNKARVEKMLTS